MYRFDSLDTGGYPLTSVVARTPPFTPNARICASAGRRKPRQTKAITGTRNLTPGSHSKSGSTVSPTWRGDGIRLSHQKGVVDSGVKDDCMRGMTISICESFYPRI